MSHSRQAKLLSGKDKIFETICVLAENDSNVIGLFLSGSRGKHFENQYSDYDIRIIFVNNVNFENAKQTYKAFIQKQVIDIQFFTLEQLCQYAELDDANAWDRYSFSHVKAIIDKTKEIQNLIDSKGKLPESFRQDFIATELDSFINSCIRTLKCHRIEDELGAKLEATNSIYSLANLLFALEGRQAPFASYLSRELEFYPLKHFPLSSEELLELISEIIHNSNVSSLQKLMQIIEPLCIEEGLAHIFEDWQDDYPWFLSYKT